MVSNSSKKKIIKKSWEAIFFCQWNESIYFLKKFINYIYKKYYNLVKKIWSVEYEYGSKVDLLLDFLL